MALIVIMPIIVSCEMFTEVRAIRFQQVSMIIIQYV